MYDTLITTPEEIVPSVPDGLQFFINYLSVLEGLKTKIKNLHWAANKLSVRDKRGAHIYLDDFLEIVSNFQDTVAECSQGILGDMNKDSIKGVPIPVNSPSDILSFILTKTFSFYENIPSESIYVGIKSETESFIRDLTKYKYLFRLTV